MAQIVYDGKDGNMVAIKNPTQADYDEMWSVIAKRLAPAFLVEFKNEMRRQGSILYPQS